MRLGDVFTITSGGTPNKNETSYYENGTIPWVKTGDLKDKYIYGKVECITQEGLENSSAKLFPKDTVLVAMYGATIGACSILSYEASTNQACAAFLPNEVVLPEYLFYFLSSKKEEFIKDGVGGAQPNISSGYLKNVNFEIIPIAEQEKVICVLNQTDTLISLRKQQLAKLDELVKARFVELFDRAENSKISKLNDVCEEITAGGDRPKDTSEIKTEEYPYPVFANAATNEGLLCFSREYKIEKPCVTIAARGCTVGFTAIRREKFTPVVRLITLVPNETVTPIYLKNYIDIKMNIEGNGAAQPQLTIPMIKSMEIMVPPIELQNQFASFVEQTDKSKLAIQKSLEKLETLKKALMQKYFG